MLNFFKFATQMQNFAAFGFIMEGEIIVILSDCRLIADISNFIIVEIASNNVKE